MMAVSGSAEIIMGKQHHGPVGTAAASPTSPATAR
jgi:hypothetical protein